MHALSDCRLMPLGCVAALAAATLAASPVDAGNLHPALRDQLSRLAPTETASAILFLEEQAPIQELSASLTNRRATRQERHYEVVMALQETAARTQAPLLARLDALEAQGRIDGYTAYWIANLVVVKGERQTIEELAGRDDIAVAEVNFEVEAISPVGEIDPSGDDGTFHRGGIGVTPGIRAINADRVWTELGITGAGTLQGGCDTGVDGNHPALASKWRGTHAPADECWLDVLGGGTTFPTPSGSHGTHVMGTQCGSAPGDTVGVAWGSEWIATNVIGQGVGNEFDNDVITSYQWFADPDENPGTVDDVPDVVQNSWRINEQFGGNYQDCDTRWWAAMDNVEAAGTVLTFSAGNEGSGAMTIGSPADRATTPLNAFSVGAIDATNFNAPYPIAGFSSRGPSGCAGNPIKPEISAPGVDVYSTVPGGGYQQNGWSGTSMAGPHVAGVVALMREADPNLEVDVIKQILIDTAIDGGAAGEDNAYGHGIVDAYEAVLAVATGLARVEGDVTNATDGNDPIPGATVTIIESSRSFTTDAAGHYSGLGEQGTVTIECTHPSFATVTEFNVELVEGEIEFLDFALNDIVAPQISDVVYPLIQDDGTPVSALITDFSTMASRELFFRFDNGPWDSIAMSEVATDRYEATIPEQPVGTTIDFYVQATDVAGNIGVEPANAPADVFTIVAAASFFADDGEDDEGWSLSNGGDTSVGRWIRFDPYGTTWSGNQIEPADDHSADPGTLCFVTGQGISGGSAGASDVDGGCVTLTSPVIDLSGATEAGLSYWRWYAQFGPTDASFTVQVSSNNGGSWTNVEQLTDNANSWQNVTVADLSALVDLTATFRFRVIACDDGADTLVEAALDDFVISGVGQDPADVGTLPTIAKTQLLPNRPNPFREGTVLRYQIAQSGPVEVAVYDAAGRLVRKLVDGPTDAGNHAIEWDGRDDSGQQMPAGVYLYKLRSGESRSERKMMLLD